jgi:hypothetical protein
MRRFDCRMIVTRTLTAVALAGTAFAGAATAQAADLLLDPEDEIAVESSLSRGSALLDEEVYGTASVERRYVERRALPGPVVERRIVEGPVLERRVIERRVAPPIEPRVVERGIVTRRIVNTFEEPVPLPPRPVPQYAQPQYVPAMRVARPMRSVVPERRFVSEAPAMEECRVRERRYVNDLGERVTETIRKCD